MWCFKQTRHSDILFLFHMGREARPAPGHLFLVLWNRCEQRSFFGSSRPSQSKSKKSWVLPDCYHGRHWHGPSKLFDFDPKVSSRCHVCSAWEGSGCFLCTDGESVPRLFAASAKTLRPNSNKQRVSKREGRSSKFAVAGTSQAKHVNWKQLRPLV